MAIKNTGAVIDDACPNCGRHIVGMMPQRCFWCDFDFSTMIKMQNPNFKSDPNYKAPSSTLPTEDEVYQEMKANDKYGTGPSLDDVVSGDYDVDSTAEEI
jgi:hypothetical protein